MNERKPAKGACLPPACRQGRDRQGTAFGGKKQIILGTSAVIILAGALIGYSLWQNQQTRTDLVLEIDRNLTAEEKRIYEDRLVDADKRLNEAASDQDRFDLLVYK